MNRRMMVIAGLGVLALASGVLAWSLGPEARNQGLENPKDRDPRLSSYAPATDLPFDFYVLALSWSPTYCADADRPDPNQCEGTRAYGFVTHGLWPQFERGYPRACPSDYPEPQRDELKAAEGIYPSLRLARLQWERHGTCSGLGAGDYFETTQQAARKVTIPAAFKQPQAWQSLQAQGIKSAFVEENPGLEPDGIAVIVRGNRLREVRICFDQSLEFRSCREVDASGADDGQTIRIPPTRTTR